MRTTNYLKLSALVLGSVIAGCSGNDTTPSTLPGGQGGSPSGTGGAVNGGAGQTGGSKAATSGTPTGGSNGTPTGGSNGTPTGGSNGTPTGGNNGTPTGGAPTTTGGATNGTPTGGKTSTGGSGTVANPTGGTPSTTGGSTGVTTTGGKTSTGGSGNTATGGTPAGTGGGTSTCTRPANVLSDFESGVGTLYPVPTSATTGFWYAYKDGTNCASAAQVPAPVVDAGVAAAALATTDSRYSACNKYAMHSSITGCPTYSGFGAAMHPTLGSTVKTAVDVSGYDGISFWAKAGTGTQGPLYLELVSKECVPSTDGGTATNTAIDQYNCHGKVFQNVSTTWTQYFVPFGNTGPRWFPTAGASASGKTCAAGNFCESPQLTRSNFLAFQFALEDPWTNNSTIGTYDIWIDDVALFKFTDAPANQGLATWTASGANAFPQNKTFTGCTKPTGADGKLIQNAYVAWKAKFVVADGSNFRVISPEIDTGNPTVSEGIGYGMLMAVYMGDKPLFDGLLGYWKAHGSAQSMLMNWKIGGTGGSGSATDADEDVAFALQMARKQWGTAYDSDASTILSQFLANDVDSGNYLKPGNTFGGQNMTNPSYFAPAFYRYFATVDTANATRWNALVANVYTQLGNISATNGLVPAWCTTNCTARGSGGLNYTDEQMYQYDSHRTPWRVGLDVCWNGATTASAGKTYLDKVVGFFAGASDTEGLSSLGDIYNSGGAINTASTFAYNSMSLNGSAGVGAMGSTATGAAVFRDRVWQFLLSGLYTDNPTFKTGTSAIKPGYTYYNATVGLLTAMTMSGNFYPM